MPRFRVAHQSRIDTHVTNGSSRAHASSPRRRAVALVVFLVAGVLAGVPAGATAGDRPGRTDYIRAGQGDVDIVQVVMKHGGQYVVQNAPASGVIDSSSTELLIESITIHDDGVTKVLDDFNFTGIETRNRNWSTSQTGVTTSENGTHTTPSHPDFWDRVESVLGSTDLRDYLDLHFAADDPPFASFEPDFDFFFQNPLDNGDYVLITERHGNTFFDLEPLDTDGNLIPSAKRLVVDAPYGWNTGYAPSDQAGQPQWFTVIDVDSFEVRTDRTPIGGFRINNDGGADVKFFALADEAFTPGCPPGSPVEDEASAVSGAWTQSGGVWTATMGSTTLTATMDSSLGASAGTMDSFDVGDYSHPDVDGNPSLGLLHWFPDPKLFTVTFDPPVANPSMHLARLGGYSGWDETVYSHSSVLTLQDGLTWTETAGNGPHFETTSNTVKRTTGTLLDWPATSNIDDYLTGMAAGSLGFDGLYDEISFVMSAEGQQFDAGTGDGVEIVFSKAAAEGCGGDTELAIEKVASADNVALGNTVEWALSADSIGTGAADNATVTDVVPAGLVATQLRTGAWTPTDLDARFEARVNGSWTTIANVDGDDDATYFLPTGVSEVKISYLADLAVDFDTTSPARLITRVEDPPTDGDGQPLPITNCATWDADDMNAVDACDTVAVDVLNVRPDLTLSNETGSIAPGAVGSHLIRVENAPSASKNYRQPFVAVLLPDDLEYEDWQPLTSEEPPTLTVVPDHNGSGRTLVRWDYTGAAGTMVPGEHFEVRLITRARVAAPAGSRSLQVVTGTNQLEWPVECMDDEVADVVDHDADGQLAESVCAALVGYEIAEHFEMAANAAARGQDDLPFLIYDEVTQADFACAEVDGHTSRPCIAQTESHGDASFQLDLDNRGNVSTGGMVAYGVLPHLGDTYLLSGDERGSDYRPTVIGEAVLHERPDAAAVTISYSTSTNPCRPELVGAAAGAAVPVGCDNDWGAAPEDLSTVSAIRVVADVTAGEVWAGGERLRVSLPVVAAQGSPERDEYAWMPFTYVLDDASGNPLAPVETSASGLMIARSLNGFGDRAWLDTNRNGIQDPGEDGVNGVRIELYDVDRNLVATTSSQDASNDSGRPGFFWFGDLEPGQYFIKLVEVPLSWNVMSSDLGDDALDSDINPLTLEGPFVTVADGQYMVVQDVGFFVPQGPAQCIDDRQSFDPTDLDADRRPVSDAAQCPG